METSGVHGSLGGDKPNFSEIRELEQLLGACDNLLVKLAGRSGRLDEPLRAELEEVRRRVGERLARLRGAA